GRPPGRDRARQAQDPPAARPHREVRRRLPPAPLGPPAAQLLILACLDHRADPAAILGLRLGDAIVIRNTGGRVTEAVIDDIAYLTYLAGQLFGEQAFAASGFEVATIQHTQCGAGFLAD